jgi:hypothetical protein
MFGLLTRLLTSQSRNKVLHCKSHRKDKEVLRIRQVTDRETIIMEGQGQKEGRVKEVLGEDQVQETVKIVV